MTLIDVGPFDAVPVTISGQDPTPILSADASNIVNDAMDLLYKPGEEATGILGADAGVAVLSAVVVSG